MNEAMRSVESMDVRRETGFLSRYVEKGVLQALKSVNERFENAPEERDRLEFHNTRHTGDVVRRAEMVLEAVRRAAPDALNARDVKIGKIAAAFHDTVQKWEEARAAEGDAEKITRKRFTKDNERASADEAVKFMEEANKKSGFALFEEDDLRAVREAIDVTVPGFDPKRGTVIQPNLNERSSIIARAVALADLGTAGIDGGEPFLYEGDALFREENFDIMDAARNPSNVSEKDKKRFRDRMLGWSKFQSVFAAGRRDLLDDELKGLPQNARETVKALFAKFGESIESAKKRAGQREAMSFEELLDDMGFVKKQALKAAA